MINDRTCERIMYHDTFRNSMIHLSNAMNSVLTGDSKPMLARPVKLNLSKHHGHNAAQNKHVNSASMEKLTLHHPRSVKRMSEVRSGIKTPSRRVRANSYGGTIGGRRVRSNGVPSMKSETLPAGPDPHQDPCLVSGHWQRRKITAR